MKKETKQAIISKASELLLRRLELMDKEIGSYNLMAESAAHLAQVISEIAPVETFEERETRCKEIEEAKAALKEQTARLEAQREKNQRIIESIFKPDPNPYEKSECLCSAERQIER